MFETILHDIDLETYGGNQNKCLDFFFVFGSLIFYAKLLMHSVEKYIKTITKFLFAKKSRKPTYTYAPI